MASEYWKWKYRDVRPDAPRVLTPAERRANWWEYHKWHVLLGAAVLLALADLGYHVLGFGQVRPDYQIACVISTSLPEETVSALESALSGLGTDCNGDGSVIVKVNQYVIPVNTKDETALSDTASVSLYASASATRLTADLEAGDSYFFLLEDPEKFQWNYDALSEDGVFRWRDCPVLLSLPLGGYTETVLNQTVSGDSQERLSGLYFARREFQTERGPLYESEWDALWRKLTEGAVS